MGSVGKTFNVTTPVAPHPAHTRTNAMQANIAKRFMCHISWAEIVALEGQIGATMSGPSLRSELEGRVWQAETRKDLQNYGKRTGRQCAKPASASSTSIPTMS